MIARMLFVSVVAVLTMTACGGQGGSSAAGPRVTSVIVTDESDGQVNKTVFLAHTRRIYVLITVADVPAGTTIKSIWYAENAQGLAPNSALEKGEATLQVGGEYTRGNFDYTRTDDWPLGDYRVELLLADKPTQTARFRIQETSAVPAPAPEATMPAAPEASPPAPAPSPLEASSPAAPAGPGSLLTARLGPIIFARGVSGTQPVGRTDRFPRGIQAIYAFFSFEGLRPEDTVSGAWYRGSEKILDQQVKMADMFAGTPREKGHLWFTLKFGNGALEGVYRLELSVNGIGAASGSFAVE